jgi:hypothetical protein
VHCYRDIRAVLPAPRPDGLSSRSVALRTTTSGCFLAPPFTSFAGRGKTETAAQRHRSCADEPGGVQPSDSGGNGDGVTPIKDARSRRVKWEKMAESGRFPPPSLGACVYVHMEASA